MKKHKIILGISILLFGIVPSRAEFSLKADVEKYPIINWATEILPENVIWKSGFEVDDIRPGLIWSDYSWDGESLFDKYGSQSFSNESACSGSYSLKVGNTLNGYNQKWIPITGDKGGVSFCFFEENIYGIENGAKLSVTYKAKSKNGSEYAFMPTIIGNNTREDRWKASYENKLTPVNINGKKIVVEDNFILNGTGIWVTLNDVSWINAINGDMVDEVIFLDFSGNQTFRKENMVHISKVNKINNKVFLQPKGDNVYNVKAGTQIQERKFSTVSDIGPASFDGGGAVFKEDSNFKYNTNTEWKLFSYNGVVFDESISYYNTSRDGVYLSIKEVSKGDAFLDDLVVGYATKVKLYRDNVCVYEGYGNSFNDINAKDTSGPSSVSNLKTSVSRNLTDNSSTVNITYSKPQDMGSEYSYKLATVNKFGTESTINDNYKVSVTSGFKGYSYIIDQNPQTIPDNIIDTLTNSVTAKIDDKNGEVYYIHIKAIDNEENSGPVLHKKIDKPLLKVEPKNLENMVRLDWTMDDFKDKIFKIYQKKSGSDAFQSISSTNFSSDEKVKVLNIYPEVSGTETFITWRGETVTLPLSARLKKWMEEPNSENPKGYGKGLIEIIPVTQKDFNANPNFYLKDNSGNWKVNVVMIGSWDDNGNETLNAEGLNSLKEFIAGGNGFLTGHDTTSGLNAELKEYLNIKKPGDGEVLASYANDLYRVGDNKIINNKKGLLTSFPWAIDKDVLDIPNTHTSYQWAFGDVWFNFEAVKNNIFPSYGNEELIVSGGKGTNNFYLTTWNNTAMIQTGHTNGQATADEQKILANTLFYLNQINSDNFLDDKSGQDIAAPDKPIVKLLPSEKAQLKLNFGDSKDNGSKYSYYVLAENKDGNEKSESNIVTTTITSGIKGYSYVLDKNQITVPDNNINHIKGDLILNNVDDDNVYYLHIKAIDNAGNVSETVHFKINTSKPLAPNLNLSRVGWGRDNVEFNLTQPHNKKVKILSVSGSSEQPYVDKLRSLGYDIVSDSVIEDMDEILKYDLIIYDAFIWGIDDYDFANEIYDRGGKLITIGDDSTKDLYPILSTTTLSNENRRISRVVKNEFTFNALTSGDSDAEWVHTITSLVPEANIIYKHNSDNSPAIVEVCNSNGGRWVHSQKALDYEIENFDEFSMGLVDYITDYISQIHVSDVQYKINNGEWISYNGENILLTQEELYTISVRNIDRRGVSSDVISKTVGIDRTSPYFVTTLPSITPSRNVIISIVGIGDSLSGADKVRISNYPDFRDSTEFISVDGQMNITANITLPFYADLNENYSIRTVYAELFDKAGNSKIVTCNTRYESRNPQVPIITSPKHNSLYVKGETVNLSWMYSDINNDGLRLPQSRAIITLVNRDNNKIYTYNVFGEDSQFFIKYLDEGEYVATVESFNSLDKGALSSPVSFRYNKFDTSGYVLSKAIKSNTPIRYLNIVSRVEVPLNTSVKGYIYYANKYTDSFDDNKKISFSINSTLRRDSTIKLPEESVKVMIRWNLYSENTNKITSPAIDYISIYGR